MGEKNGKLKT